MIENLEGHKTLILSILFNPPVLALFVILFLVGRYFGKLTKRLTWWKILIVGYFAIFLYQPVRDAGLIIGGVFVAGILSNHIGTFISMLAWAGDLGQAFSAMKYRAAYDDIRRREKELDEREERLRQEERRRAYQQREQDTYQQKNWQNESRNFRQKSQNESKNGSAGEKEKRSGNAGGGYRARHQQRQSQSGASSSIDPIRAKHLRTLGLDPNKNYSAGDIRKAWRKMAMRFHPDNQDSGNTAKFREVQEAWEWLSKT